MKKIFYLAVLLIGTSAIAANPPEVNQKVLKAFKETFGDPENVLWKELDDHCQVYFQQSEINIRAVYDQEGNLLKTIRTYYEKNLPPTVMSKLKKKYGNKEIFGITEVSTDTDMTYYITLRDEKNFYKIESDMYGSCQQVDKYKRADIGL